MSVQQINRFDWKEMGQYVRGSTADILCAIQMIHDEFYKKWGYRPDTLVIGPEFLIPLKKTLEDQAGIMGVLPWKNKIGQTIDDINWANVSLWGMRISYVQAYYQLSVEGVVPEEIETEVAQLRQAVGLLSTLAPDLVAIPEEPLKWAREIERSVRKRLEDGSGQTCP